MDYKIGKRERTNFLDQRGVAVDGYRIYYQMADGTLDYVEIEKNQFSAEAVRRLIEEEITVHEELVG